MIVDGHAHALAEFARVDSLKEIIDELGVDKVVLCPGGSSETDIKPKFPQPKENFLVTNPRLLFLGNRYLRRRSR